MNGEITTYYVISTALARSGMTHTHTHTSSTRTKIGMNNKFICLNKMLAKKKASYSIILILLKIS